jgi:transposase
MSTPARVYSREFKVAAVQRILAGEKVKAIAADLGVARALLYNWWEIYERQGAEALVPRGGPRRGQGITRLGMRRGQRRRKGRRSEEALRLAEAQARIAELERKVGQQAVELDFFARALRHFETIRPAAAGRGAPASSRSSTR